MKRVSTTVAVQRALKRSCKSPLIPKETRSGIKHSEAENVWDKHKTTTGLLVSGTSSSLPCVHTACLSPSSRDILDIVSHFLFFRCTFSLRLMFLFSSAQSNHPPAPSSSLSLPVIRVIAQTVPSFRRGEQPQTRSTPPHPSES